MMHRRTMSHPRAGFTLIEILVVLLAISLLAAAVLPSVVQHLGKADPAAAASDLNAIRTGIGTFNVDVRPKFPGDLEDLVWRVSTAGDADVNGGGYSPGQNTRWDGPYLETVITEAGAGSGSVFETGFGGEIQNDLTCFNPSVADAHTADVGDTCVTGNWITVLITGLSDDDFQAINSLIDGDNETTSTQEGRFRADDDDGNGELDDDGDGEGDAYYLAIPFRAAGS